MGDLSVTGIIYLAMQIYGLFLEWQNFGRKKARTAQCGI